MGNCEMASDNIVDGIMITSKLLYLHGMWNST
jgi:hypothetical protein